MVSRARSVVVVALVTASIAVGIAILPARPASSEDARVWGRVRRAAAQLPGTSVPVAFAVWNGSAGDRDGKKSVTIWQDLVFEP